MKKRLLSMLIALAMTLTLIPPNAMAFGLEQSSNPMGIEDVEMIQSELVNWDEDEFFGNDELLEMYLLGLSKEVSLYTLPPMNASETKLFNELKRQIHALVTGTEGNSSTEFHVESLNLTKTEITEGALAKVIEGLVMECPGEFYWWDKSYGTSYYETGEIVSVRLKAAADYSATGAADTYVVDRAKITAANTAIATAQEIVSKYAGKTTLEKLNGYREEICKLVSYHTAAAGSSSASLGINPWQLVWVFDGDTSTNVVCEGYAKAFQYLCNLTPDLNAECYIVAGTMNGGGHMWNIVRIGGESYLVDVTNCDEGSVGYPDKLFMVGGTVGGVKTGYSFFDGTEYRTAYVYYDGSTPNSTDEFSVLGEEILTLSANAKYAEVVKKDPAVTLPTGLTATYGDKLSDVSLPAVTATDTPGAWAWMNSNESVGGVGENTFEAKFIPDDTTQYNEVTNIDVTVTVKAKNVTPVVTVNGTYTYTGSAIQPADITITTTEGISLAKGTDYTVSYGPNIEPGEGTVTVSPVSTSNYTFTAVTGEFTIGKKTATITIAAPGTITYDGNPVTAGTSSADISYTYTGDSAAVTVAWYDGSGTELGTAPANAGSYQVGVSAAGGTHFEAVEEQKQTFTISRADYTYDGPDVSDEIFIGQSCPASGTETAAGVGSETVSGQLTWYTDAACSTEAAGTFQTAGLTTLYWKFTPDASAANYVSAPKTGPTVFKVSTLPQQNVTQFTKKTVTATYGDTGVGQTVNNDDLSEDGSAIKYSSSNTNVAEVDADSGAVTIKNVGETTITAAAGAVPDKYAQTTRTYKLTVNPKPITPDVTVAAGPHTYTGSAVTPDVNVKTAADGEEIPYTDYTLSYSQNINAGTASVTVRRAAGNYTWDDKTVNFTIGKAVKPADPPLREVGVYCGAEGEQTVTLPVPAAAGQLGQLEYTVSTVTDTDNIFPAPTNPSAADGVLKYTLASGLNEEAVGKTATVSIVVSSTNYADYTVTVKITLVDKLPQAAPAAPVLTYALNADRAAYTVTITPVTGAEYSFDGTTFNDINTKNNAAPGAAVTGYIRLKETATHLASGAAPSAPLTLPLIRLLTPAADPAGGVYSGTVTVTLACGDAGVSIYYTTDGSAPDTDSTLYEGPFDVTSPATVKAIAVKAGYTDSDVLTVTYSDEPEPVYPVLPSMPGTTSTGNTNTAPNTPGNPPVVPGSPVVTPAAPVSNGTAEAVVSREMADRLAEQAASGSGTVVIAPVVNGPVSQTEVTIPASAVSGIAGSSNAELRVETPAADITIPNSALADLGRQGGSVVVAAGEVNGIVSIEITAGGKAVDRVPGGVKAEIPVSCAPGTVAMVIDGNGGLTPVRKSYASDDGQTMNVPLEGSAQVVFVDNSKSFSDVAGTSWAAGAVAFASSRELMNGVGGDSFSPNATMTRGMLAVVLHNLEGNPGASYSGSFRDISGSAWYASAVQWAADNSIIGGVGEGMFAPDAPITREQLAVMLYRCAGQPAASGSLGSFSDSGSVSGWAQQAMAWAAANGIINGSNGALNPQSSATRAEVAQMLMNFVTSGVL